MYEVPEKISSVRSWSQSCPHHSEAEGGGEGWGFYGAWQRTLLLTVLVVTYISQWCVFYLILHLVSWCCVRRGSQEAGQGAAKCLCAFSLWKEMPGCRLGSDHPAGPDILSSHTFILSRPHVLNSQCVGTKEGVMAWSNTAVWYCGETSCNSLCQSARGSCFQAEEAVIHNAQRKLFCA